MVTGLTIRRTAVPGQPLHRVRFEWSDLVVLGVDLACGPDRTAISVHQGGEVIQYAVFPSNALAAEALASIGRNIRDIREVTGLPAEMVHA